IRAGCLASTARSSSPSPRLDACSGSSSPSPRSGSPTACADSTSAVPSGSSSHAASTGRPSGSGTRAARHSPPSAACTTSHSPSPPSATGSASASTPPRSRPRVSSSAAWRAERTPLRLAGDASASTFGLRPRDVVDALLDGLVDLLQRGVRQPLARKEDEADADPNRGLDRLQADAERDPARIGDAVVDEWRRDRDLYEPDVARPEREDRRDVHQHEHEPCCGERLVNL